MRQTSFKRINGTVACIIFAIAATVYLLTVEPTASLWDCSEFITCGYKLEIGHPPGAPIFMLAANLASQFADTTADIALMVNRLSALLSAGCIAFLFLTVAHLCRRLLCGDAVPGARQTLVIEAAGVTGALAYAFSDTFWFSAVEAEVYAFSSFLTALMFWLILRWEEDCDGVDGDRWLIAIAYITGLSLGVHLLCLLCLPAMAFVFHFRRSGGRTTLSGSAMAMCAGFALIALVLYVIVPGMTWLGGRMELLFVNAVGLPFQSGLICLVALTAAALTAAIAKARRRAVRTPLLCLAMTLMGYSSYAVIMIRAAANPPINENCPDNVFGLARYLNRDQYGAPPLLYGPAYTAEPDYEVKGDALVPRIRRGGAVYQPSHGEGRYQIVRHKDEVLYKHNMLLPRMHSKAHAGAYESWMGGVHKGRDGQPTMLENLRFMLSYQMGFMYWRYFLWNFVGRQNNIQGHGEVEHGNWITGLKPVDDLLLHCDTALMPSDLRANRGRNVYYALPLLLGLAGMAWQWRRGRDGRRQAAVVATLFVMTGLAIVLYLNQTPVQARERDYAYAGSFYAFAIWIGMGVPALCAVAERWLCGRKWAAPVVCTLCLVVPLQMAGQTWDDHDRSDRTACPDFGRNYLESTSREGRPILLSYGDNDTFPLWYNQEVEGVRTDVRVCNMAYAQTDWYIDQMKRRAYDSPPLPVTWPRDYYTEGRNEYVRVGVDSIVLHPDDSPMTISLGGVEALGKHDLFVLEMLDNAGRERPVYMTAGMADDMLPYLRDHLVLEGLAYRIVPERVGTAVDTGRLYDNVMHRFRYGNLSARGIYVDDDVMRMAGSLQSIMGRLIDSLLEGGDTERALAVVRKWQRELPERNIPYTGAAVSMARCLYACGNEAEADSVLHGLLVRADEWLAFAGSVRRGRSVSPATTGRWLYVMHRALSLANEHGRENLINDYYTKFTTYAKEYNK